MFGLGVRFSPIDQEDYAITKFATQMVDKNQPVPEVSAKYRLQHIDNQGSTQLCSAYTMCSKVTVRLLQRTGHYVLMSPAAFFGNREFMMYSGEGMMGRDTQQGARKSGFIPRDAFPIENGTFVQCQATFKEKKEYYKELSIPFMTDGFARLSDAHELSQYIAQEGIGTWIAFRVYENIRNAERTGIVESPSGAFLGGHAVFAQDIEYIKDRPYIKFANSWGEDWGDSGNGYLPAEMLYEAWGDYDRPPLESSNDISEIIFFTKDINATMNTRTIWTDSKNLKISDHPDARVEGSRIILNNGLAAAYVGNNLMVRARPAWEAIGWQVDWYGDYVIMTRGKTESQFKKELGLL